MKQKADRKRESRFQGHMGVSPTQKGEEKKKTHGPTHDVE